MVALECGLDALTIDERRFPDTDRHYVYEHLKYYCSKFRPLPAVGIRVDRIPPPIVHGHKYFRIARELGANSIQALVVSGEGGDKLTEFLCRPDVRIIDNAAIAQVMEGILVDEGSHVFFFEHPLDSRAKAEFDARIAEFFRTIKSPLLAGRERRVSPVTFAFRDTCAEFTAITPVGDESWYGAFLNACKTFSRTVAKIASYQGGRFGW